MILPMHYQTEKTKPELGLAKLEEFTKLAREPDASGKPRALSVGPGGHTIAISASGLANYKTPIVYPIRPW